MINIRFREKTNTWPGFVDLFSNLVIILIFLLIVFVFLWTTTSVFNKNSGIKTITELKKINSAQSEQLIQMTADEQEAKRLLILARAELENLEKNKNVLQDELKVLDNELKVKNMTVQELIKSYEGKVNQMQKSGQNMQAMIESLSQQLELAKNDKTKTEMLEKQRTKLQSDLDSQRAELTLALQKLQSSLNAAEEKARQQEIQYVDMSSRLNKALADKVAELNQMTQFQSEFYKAVKLAVGDRTSVKQDGDRFIVSSDILFSSGEYKLSTEGKNQLRLIANVVRDFESKIPTNVDWIIRVDGHTDNKPVIPGTHRYRNNTELSFLRATAVSNELALTGVSKRRLIPTGFGELHPVSLGNTPQDLQKNRRIELRLTNK